MRATTPIIRKIYNACNTLYFEGKLPTPIFGTYKFNRVWGSVKTRHDLDSNGKVINFQSWLRMNSRWDINEDKMIDVVLHEMIHIYIVYNGIPVTQPDGHGEEYIKVMNEINEKYGRNVKVNKEIDIEELNTDNLRRGHYICMVEMKDARSGFYPLPPNRVPKLRQTMEKFDQVKSYTLYYTEHPFFNRYLTNKKLRSFPLYYEDVEEILKQAINLSQSILPGIIYAKKPRLALHNAGRDFDSI